MATHVNQEAREPNSSAKAPSTLGLRNLSDEQLTVTPNNFPLVQNFDLEPWSLFATPRACDRVRRHPAAVSQTVN